MVFHVSNQSCGGMSKLITDYADWLKFNTLGNKPVNLEAFRKCVLGT